MSALPHGPAHRYTVAEFAGLPWDDSVRWELQEGLLVFRPRPALAHMKVIGELYRQIGPQLPSSLDVLFEVDVHLEPLPATVRVPDVIVVSADLWDQPARLTPSSSVVLAVEVLSPSSFRTDTVIKPLEYADAGIPHFWLIDPEPPVTATVYRLVDGGYEESERAEKVLEVDEPCPLRVDLEALLPRRLR